MFLCKVEEIHILGYSKEGGCGVGYPGEVLGMLTH